MVRFCDDFSEKSRKEGCFFTMVIRSEFCMRRYRSDDHQEDAPHFAGHEVFKFSQNSTISENLSKKYENHFSIVRLFVKCLGNIIQVLLTGKCPNKN